MLKSVFKILIIILVLSLIFLGLMRIQQPEKFSKKKTSLITKNKKKPTKTEVNPSNVTKKRLQPDKKKIEEKQKKSSAIERKLKRELNYKFSKELNADRLTHTIHVDAFLFKEFADELLNYLKKKKYPAYSFSVWDTRRQLWHVVRIGRYFDYEKAKKKLLDFNLKERRSAEIINLGTLEFFPSVFLKTEKPVKMKPLIQK